jgi:hypothetical protein
VVSVGRACLDRLGRTTLTTLRSPEAKYERVGTTDHLVPSLFFPL